MLSKPPPLPLAFSALRRRPVRASVRSNPKSTSPASVDSPDRIGTLRRVSAAPHRRRRNLHPRRLRAGLPLLLHAAGELLRASPRRRLPSSTSSRRTWAARKAVPPAEERRNEALGRAETSGEKHASNRWSRNAICHHKETRERRHKTQKRLQRRSEALRDGGDVVDGQLVRLQDEPSGAPARRELALGAHVGVLDGLHVRDVRDARPIARASSWRPANASESRSTPFC